MLKKKILRRSKLKNDLEASDVATEKKEGLLSKINSFLAGVNKLPQDTSKTCRKSAGECIVGSGCFATGALSLINEIAQPEAPKI